MIDAERFHHPRSCSFSSENMYIPPKFRLDSDGRVSWCFPEDHKDDSRALSVVVAQSCVPVRNHVSSLGRKERKEPTDRRVGATPSLGGVANFLQMLRELSALRRHTESVERKSSASLGLPHSTAIVVLPYFVHSRPRAGVAAFSDVIL